MHLLVDIDTSVDWYPFGPCYELQDGPIELVLVCLDPQVDLKVVNTNAGNRLLAPVRKHVLLLLHLINEWLLLVGEVVDLGCLGTLYGSISGLLKAILLIQPLISPHAVFDFVLEAAVVERALLADLVKAGCSEGEVRPPGQHLVLAVLESVLSALEVVVQVAF